MAFAVGMFDCDNLKVVNDKFGHEKDDVCPMTACHLICRVFQNSPVFRIGGELVETSSRSFFRMTT
ncbi:MAG: GGDEF domain-containing protein [Atopobiaceae bacterium]|nr:GGDEF domain-containing protein [Atopobiaceae bacterium]